MNKQLKLMDEFLFELDQCDESYAKDIRAIDLLDAMACAGLALTRDTTGDTSRAYQEALMRDGLSYRVAT